MKKERTGFAAFDVSSGKGITVSFGITNRLNLTDDPEKVTLAPSKEQAEVYTIWFNDTHKNQKTFEIKEVVYTMEIKAV